MEIGNEHARAISPEYHAYISRDIRVGYVMWHFWSAYPKGAHATVSIGGRYPEAPIQIAAHDEGFFERQQPYPIAPTYRKWLGRQIPFFFDPHPKKPLLELLPKGRAIIHADIISAVFYLLSGWQEQYSAERDQHGRFPYAASVQKLYDFVTVPVVNYYFDVLKTAVEHVTGKSLTPRRWAGDAPFAACITHDVDNLYSAWKAPAKVALQRRNWLGFGQQLWQHVTRKDAWNNLEEVQQAVASYGAKSTFFFLTEHRKATDGTPNADYRLTPLLRRRLRRLAAAGAEVALHGSISTATDEKKLQLERSRLPLYAQGNRFHYLSWRPQHTLQALHDTALKYDSTLGFAEHFGFRNSYCLPFIPCDLTHGGYVSFLELPLNVMDTTLHHPRYLQLAPDEVLPALRPMLQEIELFGGVCTVLWHNQNFDPANTHNGPRQFHELMRYLRSRGAAFLTGTEVSSEMKK